MEIDFIRNLYKGTNTSAVYIGAEKSANGRFNWIDGTNWDFDYMDPLNFQTGKCVTMDVQGNGLWSQVDCSQKFDFLCKKKISSIFAESQPEKSDSSINSFDASNCNSTLYLAPGSISSFGYPSLGTPPTYCSWRHSFQFSYSNF
uniref:C-type lectin domain-containing protein n=1 Tax=Caenorhabditis tropicalis TaxID=1561998 RepID=A0A1I7TY63_9PELO